MSVQHDYLLAFASADELFARGCEGIFHGQMAAYYKALVNVKPEKVKAILPGKSAAWYRQQWQDCKPAEVSSGLLLLVSCVRRFGLWMANGASLTKLQTLSLKHALNLTSN